AGSAARVAAWGGRAPAGLVSGGLPARLPAPCTRRNDVVEGWPETQNGQARTGSARDDRGPVVLLAPRAVTEHAGFQQFASQIGAGSAARVAAWGGRAPAGLVSGGLPARLPAPCTRRNDVVEGWPETQNGQARTGSARDDRGPVVLLAPRAVTEHAGFQQFAS